MKIALLGMVAGMALGLTSVQAQVRAPVAAPGCHTVNASDRAYSPVAMRLIADHVDEDAQRVWTKWELWNPFSARTTAIWQGVMRTCGGDVIVSQIVNRQCDSETGCPARVVFRDGRNQDRVLMGYQQVCTVHGTFELRGDLSELRSCGQAFTLDQPRAE